jgi:hypothetical protein
MADSKPKKSKRDLWFKFGRFITGVTLACFFLPFFGVSCEGMDVITISGADMVGGCKPGGLAAAAQEETQANRGHGETSGDIKIDNVKREPLAIAAMGLAVLAAGFSWMRTRKGMVAALALSIACVGALAGLYIKVGGDLDKAVSAELSKKGAGSAMMKDTKVDAGARFGLFITLAGLVGGAALAAMALREKDNLPPAYVISPPPGAPPPV